jgi:ribosome-binding factor A
MSRPSRARGSRARVPVHDSARPSDPSLLSGDSPVLGGPPALGGAPADRNTGRVCREVLRTLTETLGSCGDPVLSELTVLGVEPAPDASRLLVLVGLPALGSATVEDAVETVRARLADCRGLFRRDIAAALQRRRTPELAFQVLKRSTPIPASGEPAAAV